MEKGVIVTLTGDHVVETARVLAIRLIEHDRAVETFDAAMIDALGGARHAGLAAGLLARNGVIVVVAGVCLTGTDISGTTLPSIEFEVAKHDTPDFAAEKALDELAEAGILKIEDATYSDEDEERIRKRLADLGYIE